MFGANRDALREERLIKRAEYRTLLPFRPTVEAQHDRTRLLEAFRQVQPARQFEPVLRLVLAQLGPHESREINARRRDGAICV